MSLSSIRTWGWFPTSAGGAGSDASISSIRTWGWLFDAAAPPPEIPVAALFSLPIETLLTLSNNLDLPIEFINSLSVLNNIPIENATTFGTIIRDIPISHLQGVTQNQSIPTEIISSLSLNNNLPVEIIGTQTPIVIFDSLPIEYNQGIAAFTTEQLPIEIIGSIVNDFDLPIEIIGATLAWILDGRGTLWRVPARGNEWVRVGQINMEWIVDERGPKC